MRRLVVGLLLAVAAASCSSSSSNSDIGPGPVASTPSHQSLIQAANLSPCPPSASTSARGGLPDVTLACLGTGPSVRMAGLRGPAVVNVWGSWCMPCQQEATYLSQVASTTPRVRFLGVDTEDSSDSALDFDTHVSPPVHYPSVVDQDKKVLLALRSPGPPVTAFVGADGTVVFTKRGAYTSTTQLRADIARYLHVPA